MRPRLAPACLGALVALLTPACARTYHPEYHPETSVAYVQNVTYAENAWLAPPGAMPVAPSADVWLAHVEAGTCEGGHAPSCWKGCFKDAAGDACARLATMFERGDGVVRSPDNARRLAQRACDLGACAPPRRPASGSVSSPGTVIVYGDFKGNVYLGR